MARNQKNTKFDFGLLNTNQDPTDLKKPEATEIDSVDADNMVLGTLEASAYLADPPTAKTFGVEPATVEVAGVTYDIDNVNFDVGWLDEDSARRSFSPGTQPPDNTNSKVVPPELILVDNSVAFSVLSDPANAQDLTTLVLPALRDEVEPEHITYAGFDSLRLTATIKSTTTGITGFLELEDIELQGIPLTSTFTFLPNTATTPKGQIRVLEVDTDIRKSYVITFDGNNDYVVGDKFTVTLDITALDDGEYSYASLTLLTKNSEVDQEVRSPLGTANLIKVTNFDDGGARMGSATPGIAQVNSFGGVTEIYRKGDLSGDQYVKVVDDANAIPVDTFQPDIQRTINLNPIVFAQEELDDELELSIALGNSDVPSPGNSKWVKLFSFDARLWRVPTNRQDLLVFGEANPKILNWTRSNSFSFDGNIVDVIEIRDPTTVGGSLTKVVFTDNGIYNITGSGVETDPYLSIRIIEGISVEPQSTVDMNGTLVFMTKAPNGGYDEGPYGQKIYMYDLQKLVEISARVKGSPVIVSTAAVEFSALRGSDKYIIKKVGVNEILLYHRDAKGWTEFTSATDLGDGAPGGSGLWSWKSKEFTPEVLQRFRLEYARFFKIDFVGQLSLIFKVQGVGAAGEQTLTVPLVAGTRLEVLQRMPALQGRKWSFELVVTLKGTVVFDLYFVQ